MLINYSVITLVVYILVLLGLLCFLSLALGSFKNLLSNKYISGYELSLWLYPWVLITSLVYDSIKTHFINAISLIFISKYFIIFTGFPF